MRPPQKPRYTERPERAVARKPMQVALLVIWLASCKPPVESQDGRMPSDASIDLGAELISTSIPPYIRYAAIRSPAELLAGPAVPEGGGITIVSLGGVTSLTSVLMLEPVAARWEIERGTERILAGDTRGAPDDTGECLRGALGRVARLGSDRMAADAFETQSSPPPGLRRRVSFVCWGDRESSRTFAWLDPAGRGTGAALTTVTGRAIDSGLERVSWAVGDESSLESALISAAASVGRSKPGEASATCIGVVVDCLVLRKSDAADGVLASLRAHAGVDSGDPSRRWLERRIDQGLKLRAMRRDREASAVTELLSSWELVSEVDGAALREPWRWLRSTAPERVKGLLDELRRRPTWDHRARQKLAFLERLDAHQ